MRMSQKFCRLAMRKRAEGGKTCNSKATSNRRKFSTIKTKRVGKSISLYGIEQIIEKKNKGREIFKMKSHRYKVLNVLV